MPIERLSPSDELMLWPDALWPQEIGALAILDAKNLLDSDRTFRADAVREVVASRLHLAPRMRQLLYVPPRRLGGPLWVDDEKLDINDHVRVVALQGPGDEAQVLRTTEALRAQRMDRSRPLWEIWFLTGLSGGRVAMYARMHHCIADGMAGIATLASFLDVAPDTPVEAPPAWKPAPRPTEDELLEDARRLRSERRRHMLGQLAHPVSSAHRFVHELPALQELFADPGPRTSLDARVGPGRVLALVRMDFERVKDIAHAHHAKVNDVLLAAIAGGVRALLRRRGETIGAHTLPIYVPISLRLGPEKTALLGNRVSQMAIPLPVSVIGSVERLQRIAADTARRKERSRPSVGGFRVRGLLGYAFLRVIEHQRVNLESADLPGPPVPMYLAGARVLEIFPLLPLVGRVSIGVGALSYAGQFNLGVVADRDAFGDIDVFAAGMEDELHSLEASVAGSAVA